MILVLRALGLGDFLTSVPALRGLRRHDRRQDIVIACPQWLHPLISLAEVADKLLPTPSLEKFTWRGERPELAVNLHGRGPTSTMKLLATKPKELLTHRHPLIPVKGPTWQPHQHEVRRWCDLLATAGITADPADVGIKPPALTVRPGSIVIHPGAKSLSRRWPPARFAKVAAYLSGNGWPVVITGSEGERELALEIAQLAGLDPSASVAGELDLLEFSALIQSARLVICGDTGPSHLAAAFKTPLVTLFGPTSPATWGPPPSETTVVLWAGTTGDPHGKSVDRGLLSLQPEQVLNQANRLLSA